MKIEDYKLCYINRYAQLVFTDNFENQNGDDWNDSYWDSNSGDPYEYLEGETEEFNKKRGHLFTVAIRLPYIADLPEQQMSVIEINRGDSPWIHVPTAPKKYSSIYGGETYKEVTQKLKKLNIPFAILKE